MIALKYNGVFLSESITLGSTNYTPGCYVSEDLYGDELEETIRHETAHAYFYYHKKKFIQCPWIEEGLAEVAGKNTPGTFDYVNAEPSNTRYYNFLVYLQLLPVAKMQLVARHWVKGDVKANYW